MRRLLRPEQDNDQQPIPSSPDRIMKNICNKIIDLPPSGLASVPNVCVDQYLTFWQSNLLIKVIETESMTERSKDSR